MDRLKAVNLGRNRANRIGTVGVALFNSGGSLTTARSTSGISQIGSGVYLKNLTIPDNWNGIILWDDGGTAGRFYAPEVHNAVDEASYIGSMVWYKNPNNFTTANTFGQRIDKILERASSGVGGVAVSTQIFSDKEKKILFDWISIMSKKLSAIEIIIEQFKPESKKGFSKIIIDINNNQAKLQESLKDYLKSDIKQKDNIRDDLDLIANSFSEIADMQKHITLIQSSLITLAEGINQTKELNLSKEDFESSIKNVSAELKNLISQTINIGSDLTTKLSDNLIKLDEQRKNLKLTDKILISLVPTERLKSIIEEINARN